MDVNRFRASGELMCLGRVLLLMAPAFGLLGGQAQAAEKPEPLLAGHPRLYCSPSDLEQLQQQRGEPVHALIWQNIEDSAEWCLAKTPRQSWIAPEADDPIYENLYDRFYAMMMDMAITEHLAFAYTLSGERRYGEAARQWTLACCRAWKNDADAEPDGGKAYAVMRLLKGTAVGYDMAFDRLTEKERNEIRSMLATTADNYYRRYFSTPARTGPDFHTHHAIVEFSSFGVAALALLGEACEAEEWLDATVRKFQEHLLPTGLASDGAQTEGATFWASTMQYRLFFMDALRRVTGQDLFGKYRQFMNADLALASIAAEKQPGWNEAHQTVVFSPSYGQLDYYAPVLLYMAREYRRPVCQYLALWDRSLGRIQETRYVTPHRREELLFELGGYAYVWYDPTVPAQPEEAALSYVFPSVCQAYARASWQLGGLLVGINKEGQTVVHAGGTAILIASGLANESKTVPTLQDNGEVAQLTWEDGPERRVAIELYRPNRLAIAWRGLGPGWSFWSLRTPEFKGDRLVWEHNVQMYAVTGHILDVKADGYVPGHAVGNGRLPLFDPAPRQYPAILVEPEDGGQFGVEIRVEEPGPIGNAPITKGN